MKIWIDADACPGAVKEMVFRASERLTLPVCLVANQAVPVPRSPLITTVRVASGADVADAHIVREVAAGDVVITADVPLAALVVEKGAVALDPRGELYSAETVRERLSVRDFMEKLRSTGVETPGPAPMTAADHRRFASAFDRLLTRLRRGRGA